MRGPSKSKTTKSEFRGRESVSDGVFVVVRVVEIFIPLPLSELRDVNTVVAPLGDEGGECVAEVAGRGHHRDR